MRTYRENRAVHQRHEASTFLKGVTPTPGRSTWSLVADASHRDLSFLFFRPSRIRPGRVFFCALLYAHFAVRSMHNRSFHAQSSMHTTAYSARFTHCVCKIVRLVPRLTMHHNRSYTNYSLNYCFANSIHRTGCSSCDSLDKICTSRISRPALRSLDKEATPHVVGSIYIV